VWRVDQLVTKSLVVSFVMVVRDEVGERPPQVAFTERDHAIQAFLLDRADEPLRMGIAVWCPERCPDHANARCREDALDAKAPFTITIADQHAIRVGAAVGVFRQMAHGLDEEGFIGMRGGPRIWTRREWSSIAKDRFGTGSGNIAGAGNCCSAVNEPTSMVRRARRP
jgi:hypothetical protein